MLSLLANVTEYWRQNNKQTCTLEGNEVDQRHNLKQSVASVEFKYDTTNTPDVTWLWPAQLCVQQTDSTEHMQLVTSALTASWGALVAVW